MKTKIVLFLFSISVFLLLAQCVKPESELIQPTNPGNASEEEAPNSIPSVETNYQIEIKALSGLFNTPRFWQSALGGATCYVYLTYNDMGITEINSNDEIIKSMALIIHEHKSDKHIASTNAEFIKLSCNVDLKIHKGDGKGVNLPTMYRTVPVEFELHLYKGQRNIYKITCGTTANVLMIGGETARIDNW